MKLSLPNPPPPPSSMQCCAGVRATIWKQQITSLFFKVAPVKDSVSTILSPIETQVLKGGFMASSLLQ